MESNKKSTAVSRRGFLASAGVTLAAAGAAAVASSGTGEAAQVLDDETTSAGYRETEHVRTYYDLARF